MTDCPTPDKLSYLDVRGALRAVYRTRREHHAQMEPYRCICGRWHVATHRKGNYTDRIKRLAELAEKLYAEERRTAS